MGAVFRTKDPRVVAPVDCRRACVLAAQDRGFMLPRPEHRRRCPGRSSPTRQGGTHTSRPGRPVRGASSARVEAIRASPPDVYWQARSPHRRVRAMNKRPPGLRGITQTRRPAALERRRHVGAAAAVFYRLPGTADLTRDGRRRARLGGRQPDPCALDRPLLRRARAHDLLPLALLLNAHHDLLHRRHRDPLHRSPNKTTTPCIESRLSETNYPERPLVGLVLGDRGGAHARA